ncbi:MAG TPA: IS21-like element helper ATPase IstB [Chthonomonadaceae bacterium]|nr:IS21-like element helper ATPase IstB [Chthonomonadaceae bacterium]
MTTLLDGDMTTLLEPSAEVSALRTRLSAYLKELHLPTVRDCLDATCEQAAREGLSYDQFLATLLERECEARLTHRIARLLHESRLPLEKSLQTFDLTRLPTRVVQQITTLREGSFLDRHENVLAFGNPGSGKTHLLCGLCQELIHQGRRVLYIRCRLLVQELRIAKRDLLLARLLQRLGRYEAILLDDLGYVQQSREEMEVLFTLLAERYERGSVLITSNLPFSKWESIFKDPMTTAAAIDRLVHHSVILELNLSSYRMEQAQSGQSSQASLLEAGEGAVTAPSGGQ